MDNHTNLIKIYLLVCENWDNNLKYVSARHSNNANPEFTDQAIITIMTYCAACEKRFGIIEAYCFTNTYLHSWFPKLPSYVAFNTRANRNADTFRAFTQLLISYLEPAACSKIMQVVDSLPIITCSGKRTPKVATEIVSKGYCPSKSLFYHGVKLHTLGSVIEGTLPFPRSIFVSSASESDLNPTSTPKSFFSVFLLKNGYDFILLS